MNKRDINLFAWNDTIAKLGEQNKEAEKEKFDSIALEFDILKQNLTETKNCIVEPYEGDMYICNLGTLKGFGDIDRLHIYSGGKIYEFVACSS